MSVFTDAERTYLIRQRLGRLATANASGQPHVVPVGFEYNAEFDTIDISGPGLARSKKWRDAGVNPQAAFVVDDPLSTDPWRPRGLEIRGRLERLAGGGQFDPELLRMRPVRLVSWGIDTGGFAPVARDAVPDA